MPFSPCSKRASGSVLLGKSWVLPGATSPSPSPRVGDGPGISVQGPEVSLGPRAQRTPRAARGRNRREASARSSCTCATAAGEGQTPAPGTGFARGRGPAGGLTAEVSAEHLPGQLVTDSSARAQGPRTWRGNHTLHTLAAARTHVHRHSRTCTTLACTPSLGFSVPWQPERGGVCVTPRSPL